MEASIKKIISYSINPLAVLLYIFDNNLLAQLFLIGIPNDFCRIAKVK